MFIWHIYSKHVFSNFKPSQDCRVQFFEQKQLEITLFEGIKIENNGEGLCFGLITIEWGRKSMSEMEKCVLIQKWYHRYMSEYQSVTWFQKNNKIIDIYTRHHDRWPVNRTSWFSDKNYSKQKLIKL